MKILVTGSAGFIGFHLVKELCIRGHSVIGLDQINNYYEVSLKMDRLRECGILEHNITYNKILNSIKIKNYEFLKLDLEDKKNLITLFDEQKFDAVCNLAAQAGVRYSLVNPDSYINSNIVGFVNILECCKKFKVINFVYASSSSVYGSNKTLPFKTTDNVDNPISLYAATKKSNELIAHSYSHLYGIKSIGLRFFTVYGPWGRPDMALFLFVKAAIENKEIEVYNYGKMLRDFTYIDDVIEGLTKIIESNLENLETQNYKLYNIGNSNPAELTDFIACIEEKLKVKIKKKLLPIQPGDVTSTYADVSNLERDYGYKPSTSIHSGISKFIDWYKTYYSK